jgi:hypothetical protein
VRTEVVYDEAAFEALVRAYIACRLAIDALPGLPDELREVVQDQVSAFCDTIGPELERVKPNFLAARPERANEETA